MAPAPVDKAAKPVLTFLDRLDFPAEGLGRLAELARLNLALAGLAFFEGLVFLAALDFLDCLDFDVLGLDALAFLVLERSGLAFPERAFLVTFLATTMPRKGSDFI